MKKFILKITIFFLLIILCDLCVHTTMEYMSKNAKSGQNKELNELITKDKYDILILGSSQAHHHYVPSVLSDSLGYRVYNAGLDGNGIIYAYGLYKVISERYSPKLIIYNITPEFDIIKYKNDDNNMRYLKSLKPFYSYQCIQSIFQDIRKEETIKNKSALYRYNSSFLNVINNYLFNRDISPYNGYSPLHGEISANYRKVTDNNKYEIDSTKLKYIGKFIDDIKKSSARLLFIVSPKFNVTNSDILTPIQNICKEKKIPFINHYQDKNYIYNPSIFKEPMHLNDKGAHLFTSNIIRELKENYPNL